MSQSEAQKLLDELKRKWRKADDRVGNSPDDE